jgi:flavodoxin I
MSRVGLFYGSTDGHTADAAVRLKQKLDALLAAAGAEAVELFDVADYYLAEMLDFSCLILGAPTWNHGQLQRDWEQVIEEFATLDLSGKRAAVFGLGDQVGYPDTFADALFFIADQLRHAGAQLVGGWPTTGYDFRSSWAVEDGQFLGLVLDEDNQPELTETRLEAWSRQIAHEFGLPATV